jgi:hypothetical protein
MMDLANQIRDNEAVLANLVELGQLAPYLSPAQDRERKRYLSLSPEQSVARGTHWNPDESAQWTRNAREANVPLSAGPSATTGNVMRVLRSAGVAVDKMHAVATAAHAFWAVKTKRHKSGIHTMHEVLDVFNYHAGLVFNPPFGQPAAAAAPAQ